MPGTRSTLVCRLLLLAVVVATRPAGGQTLNFQLSGDVSLDEVDSVVRGHLQRAEVLTANRRWDEVIETLRQVTDNRGDRVIAVVPGYYVRLRDYCHRRLAALPPEALRIYREQVDAQAEEWFAEAQQTHDERPLRRIIDQLYCSSRGDDALRLLGEAALERGDFGAARGYWEQLLETPPAIVNAEVYAALENDADLTADEKALLKRFYVHRPASKTYRLTTAGSIDPDLMRLAALMRRRGIVGPRLCYPQGESSQADIVARLIFIDILEGSRARAEIGIGNLASFAPEARGRLGGREVNYVEALRTILDESRAWPRNEPGDDWPTFAGNAARNRVQSIDVDVGRVRWREPLPAVAAGEYDYPARRTNEDRRALLSYLPIVIGGNVFVSDGTSIRGYDLETGKAAWGDNPVVYRGDDANAEIPFSSRPTVGAPRFTLTAHNERLYARMGRTVTSAVVDGVFRGGSSSLVCLDLPTEGKVLWNVAPPPEDRWAFEGTPIADDDFVYVALRKGGVRPQAHVFCYDAETGTIQWRRMICSAETPGQGSYDEITHNLLTLVGDTIYYNTNLGAVAALSKHDGEIRWITTYPRATGEDANRKAAHFFRDLTPCVYHRGMLLVAPADSPHILGFDASGGLMQWETTHADDAVHLLGVADDCLLASGGRQWWFHYVSGRLMHYWPIGDSPKGFGRGAIAGDAVLFPLRESIEVLRLADGQPLREIDLKFRGSPGEPTLGGGHLIAVADSLIIASGNELVVLDRHGGRSSPPAAAVPAPLESSASRPVLNPRVDQ
jgi:outer membrane protein assembly factor BamB